MEESRKRSVHELPTSIRGVEFAERERRVHVGLSAWVQLAPDRCEAANLVDLSANGFRLVSDERLTVGQIVRVLGRKDASRGEIRWVAGNEAGGVFTSRSQPLRGTGKPDQRKSEIGSASERSVANQPCKYPI